jgi:HSP20 family molecular chaperone IbpA
VWQGVGEGRRSTDNGGAATGFLPLDIERTDNALLIHAPVPGYSPEEVSVTVDSGVLTIEAQQQTQVEQKEKTWIRQERFSGGCTGRSRSVRGSTARRHGRASRMACSP